MGFRDDSGGSTQQSFTWLTPPGRRGVPFCGRVIGYRCPFHERCRLCGRWAAGVGSVSWCLGQGLVSQMGGGGVSTFGEEDLEGDVTVGDNELHQRPVARIIESQEALPAESRVHPKEVPFTAVPHCHRTRPWRRRWSRTGPCWSGVSVPKVSPSSNR